MKIDKLFNEQIKYTSNKIINILPTCKSEFIPFNFDCIIVPPNQMTKGHKHDERESFLILKGKGIIYCNDIPANVEAGDIIHFKQFDTHSLVNNSEEDLYFVTLYWRDYKGASEAATNKLQESISSEETVYIDCSGPTPNGDLHLGHLSGPYLGADVCTRYLKMKGVKVYNVFFTDDFQNSVLLKSKQINMTPEQTADHFAEAIKTTLNNMNIKPDFTFRSLYSKKYKKDLSDFFHKLWEQNLLLDEEGLALFDEQYNTFINDSEFKGTCSNCGEQVSFNLCEECGYPNFRINLINPISTLSQSTPTSKKLRCLYLPLSKYFDDITRHHEQVSIRSRLRVLFDQVKNKNLNCAVTFPGKWGIPVPVQGFTDHVTPTWFNILFSFLFCIREIEGMKGNKLRDITIPCNARIVHFFGYDNSFPYSILYPAIYSNIAPGQKLKVDYICNEFLLLDGLKFSTSRDHAIWGNELLKKVSADEIRFYLCYNRPEVTKINFTMENFYKFLNDELSKNWRSWFINIDKRIKKEFNGIVPEAGLWTNEQRNFYGRLNSYIKEISLSYNVTSFSLQRVCHLLCDYVREATLFAQEEKYWINTNGCKAEHRTSIALEITVAQLFALLINPIMPNFSNILWQQLGNKKKIEDFGWPETPPFAIPNSTVDLSNIPIKPKYVLGNQTG